LNVLVVYSICFYSFFFGYSLQFGDLSIFRFMMLVLMFVVSIMFLIVSPNVISILLGWDGLSWVSHLLVIYYQNVESFMVLESC
jgi:NADH-ubiquinone oxidoreductase chain 5